MSGRILCAACNHCGTRPGFRKLSRCAKCRKSFCLKHLYSYVDGNNISITKHSPELCYECYKQMYDDTGQNGRE